MVYENARDRFNGKVSACDVVVETTELGMKEVEEVFLSHEVMNGLPETLCMS